jgi:Flp pilus assembly protein TadD
MLDLGRTDEAATTLRSSVDDYPEFALTRKQLGALLLAKGDRNSALAQYRASADINPFDPEVQGILSDLYTSRGDTALASRHARYRRILELAGSSPEDHGDTR